MHWSKKREKSEKTGKSTMNNEAANIPRSMRRLGLVVGLAAIVVLLIGALFDPDAFFHAYLFAFMLWLGVPIGCMAMLMTHQLTGGRWAWSLRGMLEPGTRTLPLLVILFVPVVIGMPWLYVWTHEAAVMESEALRHKAAYLNVPFFLVRAAVFFVSWLLVGWWLVRGVRAQRERPTDAQRGWLYRGSAAGLIVLILTVTFAAIDWVGSLEAEWYSSIFGLYIFVAQLLTAYTVVVIATLAWQRRMGAPMDALLLRDLGNLLLMLVVLHAYLAFSQFFIIWNGNLPHEVAWYVPRLEGVWLGFGFIIMFGHFLLPFAVLLFRHVKQTPRMLMTVAGWVFVAQVLETAWFVLPSAPHVGVLGALMAVAAWLGIGTLWLAVFVWQVDWQRSSEGEGSDA